jgi:hypothetical protein
MVNHVTETQTYLWLLLSFLILIPLQRWIHRHLQGILLLLTRNPVMSQGIYALLFFPGVFVHEASHWLVARLLGVKVTEVSLLPQRQPDGRLRFGFVEIADAGRVRSALIGIAPLIIGTLSILLLSNFLVNLEDLINALLRFHWSEVWDHLGALITAPDALLWLYLSFAISNAMFPSSSDRASLLPVLIGMGVAIIGAIWLWDLEVVADWINYWGIHAVRYLALAVSFTILVDAFLLIPLWAGERVLTRLTGLSVEY